MIKEALCKKSGILLLCNPAYSPPRSTWENWEPIKKNSKEDPPHTSWTQ